ncbi:hypothetical protein [Leifsonia shinshuensis]|uniref:Uncharacterized protein n=1 Tax=Leifsonia shinshuensis TaxID=150026 RepID=A0A7G6YDE7_9MICO|nr:hypothetical protein [Leifsonia shinshuensis]QNE36512.1 hypothetical protein F1C12_16270 [Leifsonia shinshuensis]
MLGRRLALFIMIMNEHTNSAVPHVERILAARSGEWVRISCDCPIGEDHTYAEWVARFGGGTVSLPS